MVEGVHWFEQTAEADRQGQVRFRLAYGAASFCPLREGSERWFGYGCAGAAAGALYVQGLEFDVSREEETLVAAAQARGLLVSRISGPLSLSVGLALSVPLIRDRFFYTDRDGSTSDVFRMSPVVVAGDFGLSLTFFGGVATGSRSAEGYVPTLDVIRGVAVPVAADADHGASGRDAEQSQRDAGLKGLPGVHVRSIGHATGSVAYFFLPCRFFRSLTKCNRDIGCPASKAMTSTRQAS